jgi:mono/diheme cytochrome c family protein
MTNERSGQTPNASAPCGRRYQRLQTAGLLVLLCGVGLWLYLVRTRGVWPALPVPVPEGSAGVDAARKEYLEEIKPLLAEHCVSCHGPRRQQGGLRLDSATGLLKGGRGGAAVLPGKPGQSPLIQRITATGDGRMPKEGPRMKSGQIERLTRWIEAGAPAVAETVAAEPSRHWAFLPPQAVTPPASGSEGGTQNPIDAFLSAARRSHGLTPVPPMDRGRLLRRVSLDLTGLPPQPEELDAFLRDERPDAYVRVVDRLLAGPRYGERWARHWMDLWRYSDEDGRRDKEGKLKDVEWGSVHLWRWREWIINAFNSDKGYDRMIAESLAADEIAPNDPAALAAMGFLVRHYYKRDRELFLSGIVEHTGKAFLGLTFNCARCHDHKFDPISQVEYYRFRAFFEPVGLREGVLVDKSQGGTLPIAFIFDQEPEARTSLYERGDPKSPLTSLLIEPGIPKVLESARLKEIHPPEGLPSSGRRSALVAWLTARENPLTARVAVNHVWARHFGKGLVENVADFGLRSKPPSHPELLDWLAAEFIRTGWSFKSLHRLIVTSRAYQMHSAAGPEAVANEAADPNNIYLWKYPSRRVESEILRDSLLSLAGGLDGVFGGRSVPVAEADDSTRRTLYFRSSRDEDVQFLRPFDPASLEDCYERSVSVVPHQALTLVNSRFAWSQSAAIAARLPEAPEALVVAAFRMMLCRPPGAEEQARSLAFLSEQAVILREEGGAAKARVYLVHALVNHPDFVTIR